MANERALIYGRQSLTRDEDDSLSLDFQEREARLFAQRQGWTVIEPPILDPDVKGWDPLRPGIQDLLRRVESDRAEVVVVYAMSRFARDYILQETIWRQLRERGARLVSVHEPHAEDDLVRGILGVVSQAERRRMGAFLSSSFRERARRGLPHGKTPFGFRKRDDGSLEPDPEWAPWIVQIVEKLEDGWSQWKVAIWLNEIGLAGRKWEPNVIRNTVRSPAIAGGIKCADVLTWDAHDAIIDRDRWERLGKILDSRQRVRRKQERSWLEGIIICGCGAPMHMITDRINYDPPKRQFRCSAGPSIQEFQRKRDRAICRFTPRSIMHDAAVSGAVAGLIDDLDRMLDWETTLRLAQRRFESQDGSSVKERKRLDRAIERANDERERLLVLYRRGTLDVDRWESADQELTRQIDDLKHEREALPEPPDPIQLRASHDNLVKMRDAVAEVAPVAPDKIRQILMAAEARVQRTVSGVRIAWPDDLALFFPESPG